MIRKDNRVPSQKFRDGLGTAVGFAGILFAAGASYLQDKYYEIFNIEHKHDEIFNIPMRINIPMRTKKKETEDPVSIYDGDYLGCREIGCRR